MNTEFEHNNSEAQNYANALRQIASRSSRTCHHKRFFCILLDAKERWFQQSNFH